ncbi:hypothetical protein COOONC_12879 [Cooperia oncophora]
MDAEAGLPEHCVALLNMSVQRGYEELKSRLESFKNYSFFISTCALVGETFQRFCDASPAHYISFLRKLPIIELVRNVPQILSLFEWKARDSPTAEQDLKKAVTDFLLATSESSIDVLKAVRRERIQLVDKDVVRNTMFVSLGANRRQFAARNALNWRLSRVWPAHWALLIQEVSNQLMQPRRRIAASRMARCGQAASVPEWEALRDEVLDLTVSIYNGVIEPDEAISTVTREMLSDIRIPHDKNVLQLFLTIDKKAKGATHGRLSLEKSVEVLIGKSEELMQEASSPDDPVLWQSRNLAEAARDIAPKVATQQLKLLDTVDLARELGSTAVPVAIKFAEPYAFLEEIVKLNGNYKQGKKCAKLAVLLGVETPVATRCRYVPCLPLSPMMSDISENTSMKSSQRYFRHKYHVGC